MILRIRLRGQYTYPKVFLHKLSLGPRDVTAVFVQTFQGSSVARILVWIVAFLGMLAQGAQILVAALCPKEKGA